MIEADHLRNGAHDPVWTGNIGRFPGDLLRNGQLHGFNEAFRGIPVLFSDGSSASNAFVFQVRRHMASSFSVDTVYTWSWAIDENEADAQDVNNLAIEKGLSL
jgi:hypothetical protein